jgi:hypothetical protein
VMGVKGDCLEHAMSKVQAVLQAVWYSEMRGEWPQGPQGDLQALRESLQYATENRPQFEMELKAHGWQTDNVMMCSQSKAILRVS